MKQEDSLLYDFQIKAIFVFNPLAQPQNPKPSEQDIQDAKLFYYYPPTSHLDEKRIQTGMAEGIFQFCDTFNTGNKQVLPQYQTIHLETSTHIICRFQAEFYLFMTLSHKGIQKLSVLTDDYFYSECHKFYIDIKQNMYTVVAQNFIENFKLFYGLDTKQLDNFIPKWIICNSRTQNTLNLLFFQCSSLRYAALDSQLFLTLQYLTTMIMQLETNIDDVLIFYHGYFVYSSLPHKIALQLKEHYYGSGLPWTVNEQKVQNQFLQTTNSQCAYLCFNNLKNIQKETNFNPQQIYVDGIKHYFTYLERSLLVLIIAKPVNDLGKLNAVTTALERNVKQISQKLDGFMDQGLKQDLVRFLYFNGMNLAYKISNQLLISKLSSENLRALAQIYDKLNNTNQQVVRSGGAWFVGTKIVDKRVILILPSTISMSKLEEEIIKLTELTFPSLFL